MHRVLPLTTTLPLALPHNPIIHRLFPHKRLPLLVLALATQLTSLLLLKHLDILRRGLRLQTLFLTNVFHLVRILPIPLQRLGPNLLKLNDLVQNKAQAVRDCHEDVGAVGTSHIYGFHQIGLVVRLENVH